MHLMAQHLTHDRGTSQLLDRIGPWTISVKKMIIYKYFFNSPGYLKDGNSLERTLPDNLEESTGEGVAISSWVKVCGAKKHCNLLLVGNADLFLSPIKETI